MNVGDFRFQTFVSRVLVPLPPAETRQLLIDNMLFRRVEANNAAWLKSHPADYARFCDDYRRACERCGPPAHIGGR